MPFFLLREIPEFILPLLWTPNLPDLSAVDQSVRRILQEKMYKTWVTDLDDLKNHIRTEWGKLDHTVIAASEHQWHRRLSVSILLLLLVCVSFTIIGQP